MAKIKKLGVLTSGGDAPGMNAAIRAVVRTAVYHDTKVVGIKRGFEGLLNGEIEEMGSRSVADIIQRGGTVLLTARCQEMMTEAGQDKAANVCKALGLDALVIIGGNGSLQGGLTLAQRGIPVYGIPGTIDLDLDCTEYSIGFDTAVNTGMKAINKIRDTSSSHERCSIVEVMGRHAGHIALWCGVTGGADEALLPEITTKVDVDALIEQVFKNRSKGKRHNLIVVAEGVGGSVGLAKKIEEVTGVETRATILGHLQRGGAPTALDRMIGSMMGYMAVDLFIKGEAQNRAIIYRDGRTDHMDLAEALNYKRAFNENIYEMMKVLAI